MTGMHLLFDTNILLAIVRSRNYAGVINFLNPENRLVYVSVASEAEIKSIAKRSDWGKPGLKNPTTFWMPQLQWRLITSISTAMLR